MPLLEKEGKDLCTYIEKSLLPKEDQMVGMVVEEEMVALITDELQDAENGLGSHVC